MQKLKFFTRLFAVTCITGMLIVPFSTMFASTVINFPVTPNGSYEVGPNFSNQLAMQFELPDPAGTDTILRSGTAVDVLAGDTLSSFAANDKFADDNNNDLTTDYADGLLIVNSADNIISSAEIITPGTADLTATWGTVGFGDENHDNAQDYDGNTIDVLLVDEGGADGIVSLGEIIHDGLADLNHLGTPFYYLETDGDSTYDDGEDIIFLEHDGTSAVTAEGDAITLFGAGYFYSDTDGDTYYGNGDVIVNSADANLDNTDTIVTAGSIVTDVTSFCGAAGGTCSYYGAGIPYCVVADTNGNGVIDTGEILVSDTCGTLHGDNFTFTGVEAEIGLALTAIPGTDSFIDDNGNGPHNSGEMVWRDANTNGILDAGEILFGASTTALTSLNGSTSSFFNDHGNVNGTYDDGEDVFIFEFGGAANNVAGGDTIRTWDASEQFSDADNDGSFGYTAPVGGTPELIANSADNILSNAEIVTAGYVDFTGFGGNYKYSDSNHDGFYNATDLIADSADAILAGTEIKLDGTVDINGFDANTRFYDPGTDGYTDQDDIITDGDQSTYYEADELTSIQIGNPGTCVDADITDITIWEDDGDDTYNAADSLIGQQPSPAIGTTISAGGATQYTQSSANRTMFVTVGFAPNPTDGCTFNARIAQNGVVLVSTNDGPTDGPVSTADTLTVDNLTPSVSAVTPSDLTISDPDAGADKFYLDIDFDDNMDPLSTPVVTFNPDIVGFGTLTLSATSNWTDTDTYRIYYDVADVDQTLNLAGIGITSAVDTAGNTQNAYSGGGESILVDTVNPVVSSFTLNDYSLNEGDVGAAALTATVQFSESMDASGANDPIIAFSSPAPAGLTSTGGVWTTTVNPNDTYTATYTLADSNETSLDIDVDITLAKDARGNVQSPKNYTDEFDIDTKAPAVLSVTPTPSMLTDANVGGGTFTIAIVFDEAMDISGTYDPTIVLQSPTPTGLGVPSGTGWSLTTVPNDTYTFTYDLVDANESSLNVDISQGILGIVLARDLAGNQQSAINAVDAFSVDTQGPAVTDANISIAVGSGNLGAYIVGDTVTVTWDAASDGTTDADPTAVFADLSGWGGGGAVLMTDTAACSGTLGDNVWEACYTITGAEGIDNVGVNATVTVTDASGNTTGPVTDTTGAVVDTDAPTVTVGCISVAGDSGTLPGIFKNGDTPIPTWDNTAGCDNNIDIVQVDFNAGAFRGADVALPGVVAANVYTATLTGPMDAQDDTNNNVEVKAYDDAGNTTTVWGTNNYTVDTELPSFTAVNTLEALKQDGTAPTLSTNIWYYYTGQNLRIQLNNAAETDGNDLVSVKGCMRSMNEHSPTQTCTPTEFATDPTTYQSFTVNAGADTATLNYALVGLPAGLPTVADGYDMNFELEDDAGNIWWSANVPEFYHAVFAVDPKVLYTGTPNINNATTTDWSLITDFTNVTNLVFNANDGANDVGRLTITGPLDLTSLATINELSNLNANMIVTGDQGDGSIDVKIDSTNLSIFDTGATVMIRVPTLVQPGIVVRDDADAIAGYIARLAPNGSAGGDNLTAITWDVVTQTLTFNTDGFTSFGMDQAGPVATIAPADGATGVVVTAPTTVTFDEEVDTTTFAYTLTPDPGGTAVTWDATNTIATIAHNTFANSTAYTLTVTGGDDMSGNSTAGATSTFTTVAVATGGGGGSAGGSGTAYVAPSTTTTEEEAAAEEAAAEEESAAGEETTTEEATLTEATQEEMAAAEEAFTDIANHWAAQYIARVFTDGYIQGYEDNTFKPDQEITRAEAAKLIAMWLNGNLTYADCDGTLFSDVSCESWYGKYVTYLYMQEIIMGYEDGTFGPDQSITRAEALKILIYAKGLENTDLSDIMNPFSDVSATDWYRDIVMIAYKLSIVEGYEDGTFGPNKSITRAEFTKIFVETLLNN